MSGTLSQYFYPEVTNAFKPHSPGHMLDANCRTLRLLLDEHCSVSFGSTLNYAAAADSTDTLPPPKVSCLPFVLPSSLQSVSVTTASVLVASTPYDSLPVKAQFAAVTLQLPPTQSAEPIFAPEAAVSCSMPICQRKSSCKCRVGVTYAVFAASVHALYKAVAASTALRSAKHIAD